MIDSSYKFKEINGRLSIADDTLKIQNKDSSFKYYNKFIGFFLRIIRKAEYFTANDIHGKCKSWVVNSNSFKNWKGRLPEEGISLDSRIDLMIQSVKEEQSRLKNDSQATEASSKENKKTTNLEETNRPEVLDELEQLLFQNPLKDAEQNKKEIEEKREVPNNNVLASIEDTSKTIAKSNHPFLEEEKKPLVIDSAKTEHPIKQEEKELKADLTQAVVEKNIPSKNVKHPPLQENKPITGSKKGKKSLKGILHPYLQSVKASFDDGLYCDKIVIDMIKSPEFKENPVKTIENLKSKNGRAPKLVYNFFTSSTELKNLEENGIVSSEIKEKLFKRALLKEAALSFAKDKRKANFKEDLYLGVIANRILGYARFEEEPFKCIEEIIRNSKTKKIKGNTERKMAYDFFISSVEQLEKMGIISSGVKEKLQKGKILKDNALSFARSNKLENFNENLYFKIIITDIFSHPRFIEEPLEVVMEGNLEETMAYRFFTAQAELEKLEKAEVISTEVKQKLLKK